MGLLWVAAAAKAAQKANGSHHHHHKNKSSGQNSYSSSGKYVETFSYYDFARAELTDKDSELRKFFEKIVVECEMVHNEHVEQFNIQRDILNEKIKQCYLPIETLCQELKEEGINITGVDACTDDYFNIKLGDILLFQFVSNCMSTDYLQKLVDREYEYNVRTKKEKEADLEEYKKQAKKLKIRRALSFDKHYYDEKLRECNFYIEMREKSIDEKNQIINCLKRISSLSDEKKERLVAALSELSKRKEFVHQLRELHNPTVYLSDEEISTVFQRMVRERAITESELQKVFLLLDKVELKGISGGYTLERTGRGLNIHLVEVMKWFVNNVYERGPELVQVKYQEEDCLSHNSLKRVNN